MRSRSAAPTSSGDRPEGRRRWRSLLARLALLVLVVLLALVCLGACFSAPRYRGPVSDHFDGSRFHSLVPIEERSLADVVRWRLESEGGDWEGFRAERVDAPVVERREGDALRVTFVGHATTLIQTAGLNVLTDPIWSERASPVSWVGPKRHAPPGVDFAALPPIDAVVVSHNHYDHLDLATLERLAEEHAPAIYLPLGNAALLEEHGIPGARDLDWWDAVELGGGVTLTCVPAQHWSGRGLFDRNAALWGGFVLDGPGGVVYFAGDTGTGPHVAAVRERFGPPRLALLPIGAYLPEWFMGPVHLDPRQAAETHLALGARASLAIHHGCFELSDEGPLDPVRDLERACAALGVSLDEFWTPAAGEAREVPH